MEKYDLHKDDVARLQFELKVLDEAFLAREHIYKAHRHSFFQVLWFKSSGNHFIDYEVISHPANTLFLIHPNQVHYFCPKSSNDGFLLHFNDSFIGKLSTQILARFSISIFNQMGGNFIHLDAQQVEAFGHSYRAIQTELEIQQDNYSEIVFHQFLGLLYQIERIKKAQSPFDLDTNSDFRTVVRFKELVQQHMAHLLSIEFYADELHVTPKKLTQLCKQFVHQTPGHLIKGMKILEAKRMISKHGISVKEVAFALGYDQHTYFTKLFKKETHLTPKQFQASLL